jgi:hypothetical protein
MSDSYVLKNIGQGVVSFKVNAPNLDTEGMPKHKKRKALRTSAVDVFIGRGMTIDLVEKLGMPSGEIAEIPEVKSIVANQNIRLLSALIEDTAKADERAEAKATADAEAEEAAKQAEIDAQEKAQQEALEAEAKAQAEAEARDQDEAEANAKSKADKKKSKGKK